MDGLTRERDAAWAEREVERVGAWLAERVKNAGAAGVVVGLSGGVDSAVVASLAARVLPGRVWGYALPCHSLPQDRRDAMLVARHAGIPLETVDLAPALDSLLPILEAAGGPAKPLAKANLKPRLRMVALNFFAAQRNALVAGTGNASELFVGYFTKWGDGGVDLLPIGHLVKGEVRLLARALALPEEIVTRTPSAGLWEGQSDEAEMGVTYEHLDTYIRCGPEAVPAEVAERIGRMHRQTAHKRELPPMPEPA